jgi:hypothetical protein
VTVRRAFVMSGLIHPRRDCIALITVLTMVSASALFAIAGGCRSHSSADILEGFAEELTRGTWVVSTYKDKGTFLTELFSGYTFTFQRDAGEAGGTVEAAGPKNLDGTWKAALDERAHQISLRVSFGDPPAPLDIFSTSLEPLDILSASSWYTWWRRESENARVFSNWNSTRWLEISRR